MRTAGTVCIWPAGVQQRYGINSVTRWRWERDRKLPARDVFVGGVAVGWRPATIEAAERGPAQSVA
jgi:predicted DNA-binding transcriptional regulator AlpA